MGPRSSPKLAAIPGKIAYLLSLLTATLSHTEATTHARLDASDPPTYDVVLLNELGGADGDPPVELTTKLIGKAKVFACHAEAQAVQHHHSKLPADDPVKYHSHTGGVGIIVANTWKVLSVHKHFSGRAIAATISKGGWVMAVVSLHIPHGLDHASGAEGRGRRQLAKELYKFASTHTKQHAFFVIGGDLNETRVSSLDRRTCNPDPDTRAQPAKKRSHLCLIEDFLADPHARCADLYRCLHPATREAGYTWHRSLTHSSASRLDYILVPNAALSNDKLTWSCTVQAESTHSDHCAVSMMVTSESLGVLPPDLGTPRQPWAPPRLNLDGASPRTRADIVTACEERVGKLLAIWDLIPNPTEATLNKRCQELMTAITEATTSVLGRRRPHLRKRPQLSLLNRLRRLRQATAALKAALRDSKQAPGSAETKASRHTRAHELARASAHECTDATSKRAIRRRHRATGRLQELLGRCPADADNIKALSAYVEAIESALPAQIAAAYDSADASERDHLSMESLFAEDPGKFLARYVKRDEERPHAPDQAVDPVTKEVVHEPSLYKRIIKAVVGEAMSVGVTLQLTAFTQGEDTPTLKPPFSTTDSSCLGKRPSWWDWFFSRDTKQITYPDGSRGAIPDTVFALSLAPVSCGEVRRTILKTKNGTSPGPGGCSGALFKLIATGTDPLAQTSRPNSCTPTPIAASDSHCLVAITHIINRCFVLRHVPPSLKEGWITMVPKKLPDGTITRDPAKMRPITVLPTLGKLGPSIIADRIGDALVRYPDVLSLHQRAHRRDGSVDQGVNTVVDIIEDWQGRDVATRDPLYLVSYDQRKAFDKVQKFTIRASMERLNMPEPLILFVLSSLTNAKSQVRTYDGLTKSFTLRSSVRQGDPLSALLYNIVTDALHEGLVDNPLFPASAKQGGYTFSKPHPLDNTPVRICSVGYADDTVIVATCPQRLAEMHAWVRAFFGANSFRLNVEKSEFLCSDPMARTAAPTLASVDGASSIAPQPIGHTIRYLGARINLDLDWSKEMQRMHGMVYATCANLRTHQFSLPMSAYVIGQYLLPRMRLGLSLVTLSEDVRKRIRECDRHQ
jgi:exonuclease III